MSAEADLSSRSRELVRDRFGARPIVARVAPLAGDASTRRYLRAWLAGPSAPATAVVMLLADRGIAMSSDELAVFKEAADGAALRQRASLSRRASASPCRSCTSMHRTAGCWCSRTSAMCRCGTPRRAVRGRRRSRSSSAPSTSSRSSSSTARRGATSAASPFNRLSIGACSTGSSSTSSSTAWSTASPRPLPSSELEELRVHFGASAALSRCAAARAQSSRLPQLEPATCRTGRIRVIDFQDALLAPAPYDLATLLGDRDTPTADPSRHRGTPAGVLRARPGRRAAARRGSASSCGTSTPPARCRRRSRSSAAFTISTR